MNDPNPVNQLITKRLHGQWRHLTAIGAPLGLALGLVQLALAQDPIITLQPTNQTVLEGGTANMTVQATSTKEPMSCQWQRDDRAAPTTFTNIPNATKARLTLRTMKPRPLHASALNRRQFLHHSGLAVLGGTLTASAYAAPSDSTKGERLRIGLIG